jgi:hypothetical protein
MILLCFTVLGVAKDVLHGDALNMVTCRRGKGK